MKRKISLLLSTVLLMASLFAVPAYANFPDVEDSNPYRSAIITLSKLKTSADKTILNGYEDGSFKPDGAITRAEFAKVVVSVLNYTEIHSDNNLFTDINDHWAKNEIGLCASLGIINGMGDGTFAPDAQVTYEQALKMLVCAIGYGPAAESAGGYPEGYINKAAELKLMNKVRDLSYKANAPRGVIAQLVYNALRVPIAETTVTGTSVTNKTLLSDYLKVTQLKGTVVGIEDYTTSDCTMTLSQGMMDVKGASDNKEYLIRYSSYTSDITTLRPLLGKSVTLYYRQLREADELELVIIDDETTKNDVIEINSEDLVSYDGSTLKYYNTNSSSQKTLRINTADVSFRYNGKLLSPTETVALTDSQGSQTYVSTPEALKLWLSEGTDYSIYGNVRLVDTGADGDINMIEIFDYETLVVFSKPTTSDYRIQDKLKTAHALILDPYSLTYSYTITKNGSSIDTTAIAANDVLLYAKSLDGTLYTVYDTAKTVTGSISTINDDFSKVTINNTEYSISPDCIKYMTETAGRELKLGSTGTFYLDMFDTISFATLSAETEIPYAYIVSATLDAAAESGYVIAYLPTTDASTAKSYQMDTKVRVNGASMSPSRAVELLKTTSANSNKDVDNAAHIYGPNKTPSVNATSQIARIKLNSAGKISEIITLSDDTYDENGALVENVRNEDLSKIVRYLSLGKYYYSSSSFKESEANPSTLFTTNSSTKVIFIPMDRGSRTSYSNKSVSSAFTSGESYYVEAYNVNASNVAGLVLLYGTNGSMTNVTKSTEVSVVAKAPESVYNTDSEETTLKLSVYKGAVNTTTDWTTYDGTEFADVQVGDVVQFAYDNNNLAQGRVNNIRFSDIAGVLDNTSSDVIFDWSRTQEPTEDNNWQSYVFDYRNKVLDSNASPEWDAGANQFKDEPYSSTSVGTVPYMRAYMANVTQVLLEENKLYVTKKGFTNNGGEWTYEESDYEELSVSSSTKVIRMESNRKGFDRYVEDTTTNLSFTDLRDAKNYGINCSKVLVCTLRGTVRLIVIYN